jgi:hypothetical protein
MLFIVGGRFQEIHFQYPKISDEEWNKIVELSGLPPEARSELQDYIGFYRKLHRDAHTEYRNLWKKLVDARNKEEMSLKRLEALISNPKFFDALAIGLEDQTNIFDEELGCIRDWLKQCCEQKKQLVDWYEKALPRLHRRQRGPRTSSLFNLIRLLNRLLKKYTGERITLATLPKGKRNPFNYVWEVCQIAEPKLDREQGMKKVAEIVRRVVTEDLGSEDSFEIEGWEELIPHWKRMSDLSLYDDRLGVTVEFHEQGDSLRSYIATSSRTPPEVLPIFFMTPPFAPEN